MPQAGFIGYAAGLIAYVSVGSYGFANAAVVSAGIFHLDLTDRPYAEVQMCIRKGIVMSEKKYKRRLGDRGDGRLVRNLTPMHKITPFIMVERNDASNFIRDSIEVSKIEE